MASLCLYNWRIFLIMKEVSKVSSYNTRRSYITKPQLHQTALFPCFTPHFLFLHTLSQHKCCSHLLQEYHGFDLGLCLLCHLAIKHTLPHLQKKKPE